MLKNRSWLFSLLFTGICLLTGCAFTQPLPVVTFTPHTVLTSALGSTSIPLPTSTPTPDPSGWQQLQTGLERRTLEVSIDGQHLDRLHILRLEPTLFRFNVAYNPNGLTLDNWQTQTGALIIINGGYFRQESEAYFPNGLTIIDSLVMGSSYDDFGGMFAVKETGPELSWLAQSPYTPDETLLSALQSFPILVKPGGELGFPAANEDHVPARRTIIAQDRAGRILLMVAPQGNLTLHQISTFLTNSDLDLDIALNLDGGPSSGILLAEPFERIPSLSPLPIVITVHIR